MKWILTKDKLPEPFEPVLIYVPNRPWHQTSKRDIHYKVAYLSFNCEKKYIFDEFGPCSFELDEVYAWAYYEECDLKEKL